MRKNEEKEMKSLGGRKRKKMKMSGEMKRQ